MFFDREISSTSNRSLRYVMNSSIFLRVPPDISYDRDLRDVLLALVDCWLRVND